jgi:hypothetical protein
VDPLYIYNAIVLHSLELLAAIAGSMYLKKSGDQSVGLFVIYLWFNFTVEIIGLYPLFIHYNDLDYAWFKWIKSSSFANNNWLYGIHSYVVVVMIGLYYWRLIKTVKYRFVIKYLIIVYCVIASFYALFKDKIELLSKLNYFVEEVVIICCIILYFFELLKSDKLLKFYYSIHFYIAAGLFVWYLCVMPIFLFDKFFSELNTLYHDFRLLTILTFNILLYLCLIFGFYYALRKCKTLVKNRSL